MVEFWLDRASDGLEIFRITHREDLEGRSGEYEIDAVARLKVFGGAEVKVLVGCNHNKNPIKRNLVFVLGQKIQKTGTHKVIIFSTSSFQSDALGFAEKHDIALVTVQDGKTVCNTRGGPYQGRSIHLRLGCLNRLFVRQCLKLTWPERLPLHRICCILRCESH